MIIIKVPKAIPYRHHQCNACRTIFGMYDVETEVNVTNGQIIHTFYCPLCGSKQWMNEKDFPVEQAHPTENKIVVPNGWIPVTDRLPEEDVKVIVFIDVSPKERVVTTAHFRYFGWSSEILDQRYNDFITHWQPLPEPPNVSPSKKDQE